MANARGPQIRNYPVLWKPVGVGVTVSELKVIDAWSSSGTLSEQRDQAASQMAKYRKQHGDGFIDIVEQKVWQLL